MLEKTMQIENWESLKECTSKSHEVEINTEMGYGWIKENGENKYYLSTHTFYESIVFLIIY